MRQIDAAQFAKNDAIGEREVEQALTFVET